MLDGRQFENRYLAIIQQQFDQSLRHLAWWRKLAVLTLSAIYKISHRQWVM